MLFSGSISYNEITFQRGLLDMLKEIIESGRLLKGDGVMADKFFLIRSEIENLGLELVIPPFA